MHIKRLVVASILLPLLYLYIMKLPQAFFLIFLLAASVIAQSEFCSMYRIGGLMRNTGILTGVAILSTMYFSRDLFPDMLLLSVIIISTIRLLGKKDPSSALSDISPVVLSVLYIPCLLGFQLFLRGNGPGWIVFLFGCVWGSDSLAYYVGKGIGRKKLYKEVSPNKTVEGAVGSVAGGSISGWLLNMAVGNPLTLTESLFTGMIIGATTIIGDLVESMFKRDAGVKDSGGIIPGHGGVLDKIDGALFAGPVLYWVLQRF